MTDKAQQQQQQEENQIEILNSSEQDSLNEGNGLNPPPQSEGNPPPAPQLPQDHANPEDARAAIAAKFKRVRVDKEPPVETTGDFLDPSQTYGQVAAKKDEPSPGDAPVAGDPPPAPTKRKLKVNGQERELTQEEIDAAAQKALAADDYLEQAKGKYKDAQQLLETTRVHVSRQNPADHAPAPSATEGDDPDGQHNPADPLKEAIEQIQYGDPDKAKEVLGKTIAEVATAAVKQVSWEDRRTQDVAADLRAHDDFVKKNPDLASDPISHAVIREQLLEGYREDLRSVGVPDEQIPTDPSKLANEHRRVKLQGQPVRSVVTLLNAAKDRLDAWRGGPPRTGSNPAPSNETRVEVNLNRDDRRRQIPQNPQRANVQPSSQPQQQPGQQSSRKNAVAAAQAARGQA
jgi:hypothetical protein